MSTPAKRVTVQYFAMLREARGCGEETLETSVETALDLYNELRARHGFQMDAERMKVVVNEEFCEWSSPLQDGDSVAFVPPVAGGSMDRPA